MIEVDDQKGCREQYGELEKQANLLLKKLYHINNYELKNLRIAVVVLFDVKKGKTVNDAF